MATCSRGWGRRCPESTGPVCVCACGGANHGNPAARTGSAPVRTGSYPSGTSGTSGPGSTSSSSTEPHDGEIVPTETKDWLDTVLDDRDAFYETLQELGLNEEAISEDLKLLDVMPKPGVVLKSADVWKHFHNTRLITFVEPSARYDVSWSLRDLLKVWLGLRKYVVENSTLEPVNIPLFKLHSPKVPGSKTSYIESQTDVASGAWSVTVAGTGMGKTKSFGVKYTNQFDSTDGDCKLIYVPITVKIELVATYEGKKFIGRGLRTEVILKPGKFNKGITSRPEAECAGKLRPTADDSEEFDYSTDRSTAVHKGSWTGTWEENLEGKLGLTAFNLGAEIKTAISRTQEISIAFELPAGHKYKLRQLRPERGISWEVQ